MAQERLILTDDQLRALERTKEEKEAHGEIDLSIPATSERRTRTMSDTSKASDAFISRPSSILTARWRSEAMQIGGEGSKAANRLRISIWWDCDKDFGCSTPAAFGSMQYKVASAILIRT